MRNGPQKNNGPLLLVRLALVGLGTAVLLVLIVAAVVLGMAIPDKFHKNSDKKVPPKHLHAFNRDFYIKVQEENILHVCGTSANTKGFRELFLHLKGEQDVEEDDGSPLGEAFGKVERGFNVGRPADVGVHSKSHCEKAQPFTPAGIA